MRSLAGAADAIQRARNVQELKNTYIDQVRALFGSRWIGVYFLDPRDPLRRPALDSEALGIPDDLAESYETVGRQVDPLAQFVLRNYAAVHQRELFSDDEWMRFGPNREVCRRYGAFHYLNAPLVRGGAVVGTLHIARPYSESGFERDDLRIVSALSTLLSERMAVLELGNCAVLTDDLTARERQVACLVIEGFTNEAVAHRLGISPNTVKFVLKNVFRKLRIASRTQLASRFARAF
jgi:DNA-binding CsgD family transcriptional regulator